MQPINYKQWKDQGINRIKDFIGQSGPYYNKMLEGTNYTRK